MGGLTAGRWLAAGAALSLSLSCVGPAGRTFVTGQIQPRQIRFVTIVEAQPEEAGGWRAACIHIRISRENTGEAILCKFGLETPLHTKDGPVSTSLAQRIAADRINEASHSLFRTASLESPLGMLCESLKATLRTTVPASIGGSKVPTLCHAKSSPVQFGAINL
ncbi:hypothetical protein OV208_25210 [Corallococcus sp. bb12-1]|uniref:hypothetical protein n=1 Tax=Corallococcus sp. bb12-1 TaxID=2996784 RepID=UPI0022700923|nr:hypothetical protein [Corallococcus sp. bb12-1]MCY1044641.1 hypothetical protein [Corallococcus sp. bb12-1]